MRTLKDKIRNYKTQKTRIEKFVKLTGNKGDKKGAFKSLLSKVKEAGGGNGTALKCQDSTSSPAAKRKLYT